MSTASLHHSFDIALATKYGIEEAILIHNFQLWIRYNKKLKRNNVEGRTWSYQTYKELAANFPYLNSEKVKYITECLIEKNVLVKGNFNQRKGDKTLWFAFADESLFLPIIEEKEEKSSEEQGKFPDPMDSIEKAKKDESHRERENSLRSGKIPSALPYTETCTETLSTSSINKSSDITVTREQPPTPVPLSVVTVKSLPFSKKKSQEDWVNALNAEERIYHDWAVSFQPPQGKKLESSFITFSLNSLKKKGFGLEKLKKAVDYAIDSLKKNPMKTDFGALVRESLKSGWHLPDDKEKKCREYAEKVARNCFNLKVLERYVTIEDMSWNLLYSEISTFEEWKIALDNKVNYCNEMSNQERYQNAY